ncbi:MAG: O-antigen ligase family protein [Oscillospiraceae bacterium]
MKSLRENLAGYNQEAHVILAATVSCFLPFYITAIFIPVIGIYLMIKKSCRDSILHRRSTVLLIIFTILTAVSAAAAGNIFGLACSFFFFFVVIIMQFSRKVMTENLFEVITHLCCVFSVGITGSAIFEKLIYISLSRDNVGRRCQSFFFNPNYMGTMLAICIIICAYKVICKKGSKLLFYSITLLDCIGLYLSGSMFAWIAIFVGVSALLLLNKEHQMLSIFLLVAAVMCLVVATSPEILPRLKESVFTTENRISIWKTSIDEIPNSPFFGKGFFTYFHIQSGIPGSYPTTHAHNLIIDSLLSYGFVGSALGLGYFTIYFLQLGKCHSSHVTNQISSFIMALAAAIIIHSMIDLTILWVQTGLLVAVLLGGVGAEEKTPYKEKENDYVQVDR